jgi:hypothetical protein
MIDGERVRIEEVDPPSVSTGEAPARRAVVLAHELAHAYTHLGRDIDGRRWEVQAFRDSEHALKEGLAQYYTARVAHRLLAQVPGCRAAYEALLPHQPRAYRAHVPWLADFTPEEVRYAMIAVRREASASLAEFERRLVGARRGDAGERADPDGSPHLTIMTMFTIVPSCRASIRSTRPRRS